MKKFLVVLMASVLMLSLAACNKMEPGYGFGDVNSSTYVLRSGQTDGQEDDGADADRDAEDDRDSKRFDVP